MLNISNLIKMSEHDEHLRDKLSHALGMYFKNLKMDDEDDYKDAMDDIYKCLYGDHFNHETAIKAVANMLNVDDTTGEHWSISQVESVITQNAIPMDRYNKYDFYYVINMLYSDFQKVIGNDVNMYVKMARAWLEDPDVADGKAFRYYKKVVRG